MLVVRTVPGGSQFSDTDPANGLVEFSITPDFPEIPVVIKACGYNSTGAPHDFEFFLAPEGPLVPGGPRIVLLSASAANNGTICPTPVPRDDSLSWTLRFSTTGKGGDGTLSLYFVTEQI